MFIKTNFNKRFYVLALYFHLIKEVVISICPGFPKTASFQLRCVPISFSIISWFEGKSHRYTIYLNQIKAMFRAC